MRIDPTFPQRRTENDQDARKILQRLGETAGISRTHAVQEAIGGWSVKGFSTAVADVYLPGCRIGDTVEIGAPRDLPYGVTVTGVVLENNWVELRAANTISKSRYIPGRDWKIITRGFGDG